VIFFSLKLNDALSYEILYLHTEETDIRDKDKKKELLRQCAPDCTESDMVFSKTRRRMRRRKTLMPYFRVIMGLRTSTSHPRKPHGHAAYMYELRVRAARPSSRYSDRQAHQPTLPMCLKRKPRKWEAWVGRDVSRSDKRLQAMIK